MSKQKTKKQTLTHSQIKKMYLNKTIDDKELMKILLEDKNLTQSHAELLLKDLKKELEKQEAEEEGEEKAKQPEAEKKPVDYYVIKIQDPQLQKDVLAFLDRPDLLYQINQILGYEIVGEKENRLLVFVLCIGFKTPYKQIIIIKGESASGKNWLCDHVIIPYFPYVRERGRMTQHALDYSEIKPWHILYIKQLFAHQTGDTLKLVSTSDGGYAVETTYKDPETGEFSTGINKIPPVTLVTTTTFTAVDKEMETRAWSPAIDESPKQTEEILKYEDKVEEQKLNNLMGTEKTTEKSHKKMMLRCAIGILPRADEVIIPFELAEYFPTKSVRVRRDFKKFKDLIRLIASLHYRQRTVAKINEKYVLFAAPEDVYYALQIGGQILSGTMMGIDKRVRYIAEFVKTLSSVDDVVKISSIMNMTQVTNNPKSRSTIYWAMRQLEEIGAVTRSEEKAGRENVYIPTLLLNELLSFKYKSINYSKLRMEMKSTLDRISSSGYQILRREKVYAINPFTGNEIVLE